MAFVAAPSTRWIMQNANNGPKRTSRKQCTYVIVGNRDAGLLFVSSALSMSHLGRWSWPCLLILLAMGSVKPHVRRWNQGCGRALNKESSCCHACNICALQIGLQGAPGPSQLTSGTFKVPECRRIYHSSDSMALKRGAEGICETAAEGVAL